jgi:hypothetical protein
MKTILTIVVFALVGVSYAANAVVYPAADAHIDSSRADTVLGTASEGFIGQDQTTGALFHLLAMFNIANFPPTVNSARIEYVQVYGTDEEMFGPAFEFDVHLINSNFSEANVTWNNAPALASQLLDNHQDGDTEVLSFPCTTAINSAKSQGKTIFAVRISSSSSAARIYMRESSIDVRPILVITY